MTGVAVVGPGWGDPDSGRFGGRYPLAVERHTMRQVAALVPGVTTVTPHARYYTLHALVAAEASERGLAAAETVDLLRRAEVVMAAVTLAHGHHPGFPQPHGSDRIAPALRTGRLDVTALAAPNVYVQAQWGFSGPYVGSESLLGLVDTSKGSIRPGESLDTLAVRDGLNGLLDLAREDVLDMATLRSHTSLCLCGAARGEDGELLRSLLLPTKVVPSSAADHRSQTIRMLLRLLTLKPAAVPTRDLWHVLAFDPTAAQDPVLVNLEATPAWTGLVLRGQSVAAWRNLWAWLVDQIEGLMEIRALADALAQSLPDQTVREFEDALPPVTHADGRPAPAEIDPSVRGLSDPERSLVRLALGARRVGTLEPRATAYFEGKDDDNQQLTPTWMLDRMTEWGDRSMQDFGRYLVRVLVERSQRIALKKTRYRSDGVLSIPSRVYVRDEFIFRDSSEGGGGVALRWDQLTTVLGGLGYVQRNVAAGLWEVTDRGRSVQ